MARVFGAGLVARVYAFVLVSVVILVLTQFLILRFVVRPQFPAGWARHVVENVAGAADPRAEIARVAADVRVYVSFYDEAGRVVVGRGGDPPLDPTLRARLADERLITRNRDPILVHLDATHRPAAYATVSVPPSPLDWTFQGVATLLGGALAALVLTSLLFGRSLATPLARLVAAARRFGAGDMDARSDIRRSDELGEVGKAFDDMAARVSVHVRSQRELLANLAHEISTPLARIQVALDLAGEGDAALARESLADIAEDLAELEVVLDDVLTTARLDVASASGLPSMQMDETELRPLLDRTAARFKARYPLHVFAIDVAGDLGAGCIDARLLRRAIDNLLDNAGKYSDAGSTVRLRAERTADGCVFEVADQGIGIAAEDIPQLFTPFFRTDRSRARETGGVGLGLALVRRIAEAHGGSVTARSVVGAGTTMQLRISTGTRAKAAHEHEDT